MVDSGVTSDSAWIRHRLNRLVQIQAHRETDSVCLQAAQREYRQLRDEHGQTARHDVFEAETSEQYKLIVERRRVAKSRKNDVEAMKSKHVDDLKSWASQIETVSPGEVDGTRERVEGLIREYHETLDTELQSLFEFKRQTTQDTQGYNKVNKEWWKKEFEMEDPSRDVAQKLTTLRCNMHTKYAAERSSMQAEDAQRLEVMLKRTAQAYNTEFTFSFSISNPETVQHTMLNEHAKDDKEIKVCIEWCERRLDKLAEHESLRSELRHEFITVKDAQCKRIAQYRQIVETRLACTQVELDSQATKQHAADMIQMDRNHALRIERVLQESKYQKDQAISEYARVQSLSPDERKLDLKRKSYLKLEDQVKRDEMETDRVSRQGAQRLMTSSAKAENELRQELMSLVKGAGTWSPMVQRMK